MAGDAGGRGGPRFLLITLFVAVGVLAFYYWDASSANMQLVLKLEEMTSNGAAANRTIYDLNTNLDAVKAQLKNLEEELTKQKTAVTEKEKMIATMTTDRKTADDKAAEELKKMTEAKDNALKESTDNKAKLDECTNGCEAKIKAAKDACSDNKQQPT